MTDRIEWVTIADPATGRWITSHVMNQDFVTWVGPGRIADRPQEYLAPSDRGIVRIRRRFLNDLEALKDGRDPNAVVHDPASNRAIVESIARLVLSGDPVFAAAQNIAEFWASATRMPA